MPQIFISYRRNDSAYLAANLNEKLQERFGPNSVFFDIDNIPLGVDFREHIGNAVGQCDVLLAIIGDQWMGIDGQGKRRIDDPSDYVRVEIESALKRKVPVIPVLVETATMPSPSDLPPALESLAFHNFAEIRPGRDLRQHTEQLIQGLEPIFKAKVPVIPPAPEKPRIPKAKRGNEGSSVTPRNLESTALTTTQRGSDANAANRSGHSLELLEAIKGVVQDYSDSHLHFGDATPPKRIAKAIASYAPQISPGEVLFFYDNTNWGFADDGVILTSDAAFWRNFLANPEQLSFAEIANIKFKEGLDEKLNPPRILLNQEEIKLSWCDKSKLSKVRRFFLADFSQVAKKLVSVDVMAEINALGEVLTKVIRVLVEHSKTAGTQDPFKARR